MQNKKHKGKGPLLFTAALIISCPILMAEQAKALSTGVYGPFAGSYTGGQQYPLAQKSPLGLLPQHQQKTNSSLKQTKLSSLSSSPFTQIKARDLESSQAELAEYKAKLLVTTNTLADLKTKLNTSEDKLNTTKTRLAGLDTKILGLNIQIANQQVVLDTATAELNRLKTLVASNLEDISILDAALTAQTLVKNTALANLQATQQELNTATSNLQAVQDDIAAKQTSYEEAQAATRVAQTNFEAAQAQLQTKQQEVEAARVALQVAQNNYDTNLIPDPNWTAPTYQKEHTRTVTNTRTVEVRTQVPTTTTSFQEQIIPNLLFNSDFSRGNEGWSGLSVGWQNSQPGYFNGNVAFSYMNQTVSQGLFSGPFQNATLTLSADWFNDDSNRNITDSYSMTVTARDIDQNPVGTATYTSTGRHDWQTKSVTLTATGPVSYVTVEFSGIDNGYWAGNYGPRMKNPTLSVSHGQMVTQTTYEEVITYEEEIYYTTETYYTTEVIQPQQGLTARVYNQLPSANPQRSDTAYNLCSTTTLTSINHQWGGGDILGCGSERVMIHYTGYITPTETITSLQNTADDGFYMDVDGVNVINNWTLKGCGGNWNPVTLEAGRSYAIDAWFYEWGGGACSILNYQSATSSGVVPEAWYSNGASAPLIKNPALLPALESAQEEYSRVSSELNITEANLDAAQSNLDSATSNETDAHLTLTNAQANLAQATSSKETATSNQTSAQQEANTATSKELEISAQKQTAISTHAENQNLLTSSEALTSNEESKLTTYKGSLTSTQEERSATVLEISSVTSIIESTQEEISTTNEDITSNEARIAELEDLVEELSKPEPEPEGSTEIPEVIENLMDVNLAAVDPTELTEAQAEQLVEAALETFETATEGSAEYEQALDALALAAQQDDIVVDESLAAIPGVGEAAKAVVAIFNLVGNVGADISPKKRKEAQNLVVTTLVVGQIAQAAALASASSGGSFRRK